MRCYIAAPRSGEGYNLGGRRENSVSILEAFALLEALSGRAAQYEYVEEARRGDHICHISDLRKMRAHYPQWDIAKDLRTTMTEIWEAWAARTAADGAGGRGVARVARA